MKNYILIAFSLLLCTICVEARDSFVINKDEITVPPPKGFVRVTDEMTTVKSILQLMDDPTNDTLAYYISESDLPAALAGELTDLKRTYFLKVNKQLRRTTIDDKYFANLKIEINNQNHEIAERVKLKLRESSGRTIRALAEDVDLNLVMKISKIFPLEPHYEDSDSLSYSMFLEFEQAGKNSSGKEITVVTNTLLRVNGSLLFLYCTAPSSDLEWTRISSLEWRKSVVDSNVRAPKSSRKFSKIDADKKFLRSLIAPIAFWIVVLGFGGYVIHSSFRPKKP